MERTKFNNNNKPEVSEARIIPPLHNNRTTVPINGSANKFRQENIELAYMGSLLGMSYFALAEFFEISEPTLYGWIKRYPEFKAALRKGGVLANMAVSVSFFKRATGYDKQQFATNTVKGITTVTPYSKHYPASDVAAMKWLGIKNKEVWADTRKSENKLDVNVSIKKDELAQFSHEELLAIENIVKGKIPQLAEQND